MYQKTYTFTVHSISRVVIGMVLSFLLCFTLIEHYYPVQTHSEFIMYIKVIITLAIVFFSGHLFGRGKVKLEITPEEIRHIWIKHFMFNNEKNFSIPWDGVVSSSFYPYRSFDKFSIELSNNLRYKQYRFSIIPLKDDFKDLVKDFPELQKLYKS